jgi:iron complex outermembrane receptor protein
MVAGAAATAPAESATHPGTAVQGNAVLEVVVVTALKREESIQDVPAAVTAVSGESLAELSRRGIAELGAVVPSVSFSEGNGEAQIYIRGIGSNLIGTGADPSVAINIDGVYLGRSEMGLTQFLDVDRVEVLRGPQGTLYGRNATGGAINIVSLMPTQTREGYVSGLVGAFSNKELRAAVGGPIAPTLSFRIAGRYQEDDGYTRNLSTGSSVDDSNIKASRGVLQWEPAEALRIRLIGDYSEFSSGNTSLRPLDSTGAATVLGAVPTAFGDTRNDLQTFSDWTSKGITATLDWRLANATLTSISAYRPFSSRFNLNTDGTEIDITRSTIELDTDQYSEELRLAGDWRRLKWIVGAYYLKEDKHATFGVTRVNLVPGRSFILPAENHGVAKAAFFEGTYSFTDRFSLVAGVRYSDEDKTDDLRFHVVLENPTIDPGNDWLNGVFTTRDLGNVVAQRQGRDDWQSWTPKFGLNYRLSGDALLYASYTEGFKSGGFNDTSPANPPYGPENVTSYEVGAKSRWPDAGLRLNAAVFQYDYSDLQVLAYLNGLNLVTNAANSKVRGLEIDAEWNPIRVASLGLSLALLDAKYDKFLATYGICSTYAITVVQDASCIGDNLVTGLPIVAGSPRIIDASGHRLNNAPRTKGTLYSSYSFVLPASGSITAYAQVAHQSEIFFNPANDAAGRQPGVTTVDVRLSYLSASRHLGASLFGKNLTDQDYLRNIVQFTSTSLPPPAVGLPAAGAVITDPLSIGNPLGYPAPGRSWGIEATYKF